MADSQDPTVLAQVREKLKAGHPLPWYVGYNGQGSDVWSKADWGSWHDGDILFPNSQAPAVGAANSELAVLAVNALEPLVEALEGMMEMQEITLAMVEEKLGEAVEGKHNEDANLGERLRFQGIADAMRMVRIYLEDNEGTAPVVDANKALADLQDKLKEKAGA